MKELVFTAPEEIRRGDKFRVWSANPVSTITAFANGTENGVEYGDRGYEHWNNSPNVRFEVMERAPRLPEHYPARNGDVWQGGGGYEFYISNGYLYHDSTGKNIELKSFNENTLKNHPDEYRLVYRKGNTLR